MSLKVMWFRKDLRLEDNTALTQAVRSLSKNDELMCVFHLDETQFRPGTHSHDYFFDALNHFIENANKNSLKVHLLTGELLDAFEKLKQLYPNWDNLFFNADNRGYGKKRDDLIKQFSESKAIQVYTFEENHLHHATEIKKEDGSAYKKFTPYYKKWQTLNKPSYQPLTFNWQSLNKVNDVTHFKEGERVLSRLLERKQKDFSNIVGEAYANKQLSHFLMNRLEGYEKKRDFPSINGTSRLSPNLSTGQISIRKIYHACLSLPMSGSQETFIRELAWRDFYHMIYYHYPMQYKTELIEKYQHLPWSTDETLLKKWQTGQTGYPIIDAAMRQLNETGWMHNRLRMLVASFLTKDLLVDWRLGAAYFSEQLIDYDSASNIGGWQWAASTGTDAVPYFRIFSPTKQGTTFDINGDFIKRFVPELAHLPLQFIHEPSRLGLDDQKQFGVILGKDYPFPIVDHNVARKRALDWFRIHS